MTQESDPLTAHSTVSRWLTHPEGGPALRDLLARSGVDERLLAPVRHLPLQEMVVLSRGALSQDAVHALVAHVNGGVVPAGGAERIVPGRFSGQTVIVTGAASGIGRATAARIAREGGRVVAADVSPRLDELVGALPDADITTVTADLARAEQIERIIAVAGTRIDGLANVAGVADDFTPIHEVSDETWERTFAVNVDGLFRLTRAVVPAMLGAGRGSIVNVASEAALRGSASGAAYTASKHAVVGITRSAAFMYGPHGIRVNAVAPGGVATPMAAMGPESEFSRRRVRDFMALIPPLATADQVASSITFLLSDDGANVSGAVLPSDGGWSVQ
ncbi:SDR family oxidoreductase [Nonomuraea sp. NPDC046802]|uniref:SDR family NAD(P)-dependent oxidoreductase n=1 Tax=Nonomuraea sp. NPDC046802 TaxID=3154919 RepID=UPI0034020B5C